jgi:hypothetical protein
MTNDCSSEGQQMNFNDAASVFSQSAISFLAPAEMNNNDKIEEVNENEPKLSQAERESFFAPLTFKATAPEFKPTFAEFKPTFNEFNPTVNTFVPTFETLSNDDEAQGEFEPAYKQKEKTEICKFWLNGESCKFGDECAFAHGEDELVKKTHVASKYRMTLCKSYTTGQGYCQYGVRCQFSHIKTDFSDFDNQKTRYQNLLSENAAIMKSRIDQVANPDVSTFNIAMPSKGRLAIFESICPENDKAVTSQRKNKNN